MLADDPSALPEAPASTSVPLLIVVLPEKVFVPVRVSVPRPDLINATSPWAPAFVPAITPANVVETPVAGFTVNVPVLATVVFFTVPVLSPANEATLSLRLA